MRCLAYDFFRFLRRPLKEHALKTDSRGVRVKALYREDLIFAPINYKSIDAAVELLSHLDSGSPAAAIAGGWGAIEGLLADPNDRASAADNLAALVACSLPRAELTKLAYKAKVDCIDRKHNTNRERSRLVAELILKDQLRDLDSLGDRAAVFRMRKILANPHSSLLEIKEELAEALHRLYRQRNLILHGAKLDGVSLTASLRTVSRIVGAGMDRITHGEYVGKMRPLELVALANQSLSMIAERPALACVEMLERE